jgi:hypothetical protein
LTSSGTPFVGAGVQLAVAVAEIVSRGPNHGSAETELRSNHESQKVPAMRAGFIRWIRQLDECV